MMSFIALPVFLTFPGKLPPVLPDRHSNELAREVAKYIVFDTPLLFQLEFTKNLEPIYSVIPLSYTKKPGPSWRFLYHPRSAGNPTSSKISFVNGQIPIKPRKNSELETGKSFQLAIKRLEQSGQVTFPFIISLRESNTEWRFIYERVPRVTGGTTTVTVSRRDHKVAIIPGH